MTDYERAVHKAANILMFTIRDSNMMKRLVRTVETLDVEAHLTNPLITEALALSIDKEREFYDKSVEIEREMLKLTQKQVAFGKVATSLVLWQRIILFVSWIISFYVMAVGWFKTGVVTLIICHRFLLHVFRRYPIHRMRDLAGTVSMRACLPMRPLATIKFALKWVRERYTGAVAVGPTTRAIVCVPADCVANEVISIRNRILKNVPECKQTFWDIAHVLRQKYLPLDVIRPLSKIAWLNRFPGAKNKKLLQLLNDSPVKIAYNEMKRLATRKMFIKREILFKDELTLNPRAISAVDDRLNLILGPWVVALNDQVKVLWDRLSRVTYASGSNATEIGLWLAELPAGGHLYNSDISTMDASVGEHACKFEHAVYQAVGFSQQALDVLRCQLETRGVSQHGIRYSIPYTRKSGDPNTTLGNSILNAFAHVVVWELLGLQCRLLVMGDDAVLWSSEHIDVRRYTNTYRDSGFELELTHNSEIDVEFCSSHFVPVERGFILTPKLGRFLAKLPYRIGGTGNNLEWFHGVLIANLNVFSHIDFMTHYLLHLKSLLPSRYIKCTVDEIRRVSGAVVPTSATSQWLFDHYGLDQVTIEHFKSYVNGITLETVLDHPLVDILLAVDGIETN